MKDHPAAADFESFFRGSVAPERAKIVVRHLLAACSTCSSVLMAMGWTRTRLERLTTLIASDPSDAAIADFPEGHVYSEAFLRAWSACLAELDSPSTSCIDTPPEELEDELLQLDDFSVAAEDRVPDPRVIEAFIERSHQARYDNSKTMLFFARLARRLSERCDASRAGGPFHLADLRARSWGQLGNALRVVGRLHEAEKALVVAEQYAASGSGDRTLRVELLSWKGSLCTYQRHFSSALGLLDKAIATCHEMGDSRLLSGCLIRKAIANVYAGDPQSSIGLLHQAVPLIEPSDQRLLLAALHNLIFSYIEAGRLQEALALFPEAKSLSDEIHDELANLRLLWQEGKILFELDLLEEAEALFSRARIGFTERDLAYPAAVVSLDLAAVYLRLGLSSEVRRIVADVLPIFSSLQVGRDLLASLIELQKADDQNTALQLIRSVARRLAAGPKVPSSI
jgi:tetratricopeptide (TPR) repeat protein